MNRTNPSFDLSSNGLSIPDEITVKSFCEAAWLLLKQIYHNLFLLRLPAMYSLRNTATDTYFNSLLREWKALNGTSAVLTAAILALIIPQMADDPVTRNTAMLSLVCALMSLSYGTTYIVKFGTISSMLESSKWEEEIGASTATWWNNCVLLAMPAVSMSWSMLLFLGCIVSLVWFKGSGNDPSTGAPMSTTLALGPRVAITGLLVVGTFYLAMIVKTLTRYEKEREEMRADAEMSMGAVSVQNGEPEDRGREI